MKRTKLSSSPTILKFLISWQLSFQENAPNLTDEQNWRRVMKRLELSRTIQESKYFSAAFKRRESDLLSQLAVPSFLQSLTGCPATISRLKTVATELGREIALTSNISFSQALSMSVSPVRTFASKK